MPESDLPKRKSSPSLKRPSTAASAPPAGLTRRTPGSGSLGRPRTPERPQLPPSGSGLTPAVRAAPLVARGVVAGRRAQGLGLASKMSLAIAGLLVLVVGAWGTYQYFALRSSLENSIKRNGAMAALILQKVAERKVAEYLDWKAKNPEKKWDDDPAIYSSLDELRFLRDERGGRMSSDAEDVVIVYAGGQGSFPLASAAGQRPQKLEGRSQLIEGRIFANVTCLEGYYQRQNRSVPALQFSVPVRVENLPAGAKATAYLIVSTERIGSYVNELLLAAVVAGALCLLAGVVVAYLLASGITQPVRGLMRDMDVVSRGNFDHVTKASSTDEIGLLALAFNDMTKSLRAARELEHEAERVQSELNTAREIQTHLLPAKIPQLPGFDIYPAYSPAKEVGGDYFDFIPVDRENLGVVVADVSGKGIPGSMVMAQTRAILRMLAFGKPSASDALAQTNSILAHDIKRGMFVTMLYAVLNVRQKTLRVASAGHNPMVLVRSRNGEMLLVNPAGIALGFDKGPIFNRTIKEQTIQLYKGDRVVLYTDGVVEAMNEKREEFGDERFYKWAQANAHLKSREFVNALLKELEAHRGRAEQHDDITVVTVKVE